MQVHKAYRVHILGLAAACSTLYIACILQEELLGRFFGPKLNTLPQDSKKSRGGFLGSKQWTTLTTIIPNIRPILNGLSAVDWGRASSRAG